MHLTAARSWMRHLFFVRKSRWWPILQCILWISQCVFKRIKSVSASCRGSDSDLVPVHVCRGLSLQAFLLSRGPATQQAQITRHSRFSLVKRHHDNLFQRLWCLSMETMSLFPAQWATIPSLDAADPAYGAAWSSERWSNAVPPVFGGRRWCRFSDLWTKTKREPSLLMTEEYLVPLCTVVVTRNQLLMGWVSRIRPSH